MVNDILYFSINNFNGSFVYSADTDSIYFMLVSGQISKIACCKNGSVEHKMLSHVLNLNVSLVSDRCKNCGDSMNHTGLANKTSLFCNNSKYRSTNTTVIFVEISNSGLGIDFKERLVAVNMAGLNGHLVNLDTSVHKGFYVPLGETDYVVKPVYAKRLNRIIEERKEMMEGKVNRLNLFVDIVKKFTDMPIICGTEYFTI